jgi:hypothetical protein
MREPEQTILKDAPPLAVGGGFIGFASFADATEFIQQLGIWFGTLLVVVTLAHRIFMFWKDALK